MDQYLVVRDQMIVLNHRKNLRIKLIVKKIIDENMMDMVPNGIDLNIVLVFIKSVCYAQYVR